MIDCRKSAPRREFRPVGYDPDSEFRFLGAASFSVLFLWLSHSG